MRMPTRESLIVLIDQDDISCAFCGETTENISNLLFTCRFGHQIWYNLLAWLNISIVFQNSSTSNFIHLCALLETGDRVQIASTIWIGIIWTICTCRNDLIFNNISTVIERVIVVLKVRLWSWITTKLP